MRLAQLNLKNPNLKGMGAWMMLNSLSTVDPMQTTLREGGPYHTRDRVDEYCRRLRETGRAHHAETLERLRGGYLG